MMSAREVACHGQRRDRAELLRVYSNTRLSVEIYDDGATGCMLVHGTGESFTWRWDAPWFATLDECKEWLTTWEGADDFVIVEDRGGDIGVTNVRATRSSRVLAGARAELTIYRAAESTYALARIGYRVSDWHLVY